MIYIKFDTLNDLQLDEALLKLLKKTLVKHPETVKHWPKKRMTSVPGHEFVHRIFQSLDPSEIERIRSSLQRYRGGHPMGDLIKASIYGIQIKSILEGTNGSSGQMVLNGMAFLIPGASLPVQARLPAGGKN